MPSTVTVTSWFTPFCPGHSILPRQHPQFRSTSTTKDSPEAGLVSLNKIQTNNLPRSHGFTTHWYDCLPEDDKRRAQRHESSLSFPPHLWAGEVIKWEIFQPKPGHQADVSGFIFPLKLVLNAILFPIIELKSHASGDTSATLADKSASCRCDQVASFPAASPSSWPRSLLAFEG